MITSFEPSRPYAICFLPLVGLMPSTAPACTMFVSNEKGNSITVIDAETFPVTSAVKVGCHPHGTLIRTNGVSNNVSVIDVERLSAIKSIGVGRAPCGVAVTPE